MEQEGPIRTTSGLFRERFGFRLGDTGPFLERPPQDNQTVKPWEEGLGFFDVFSLIVNKMIGTGIYTSPITVYLMIGNKILTLGLYVIGFIYCLTSTAIYLQYAEVLPYNGGELVYLDEITSLATPIPTNSSNISSTNGQSEEAQQDPTAQTNGSTNLPRQRTNMSSRPPSKLSQMCRNLMGDGLLAYIIYSIMFMVFFNSATNSLQFGRMVLMSIDAGNNATTTNNTSQASTTTTSAAAAPTSDDNDDTNNDSNPDGLNLDLMRFIGVMILSLICLLQFFSPAFGRNLNKLLAVVKIIFLIGVIGVAISTFSQDFNNGDVSRAEDWYKWHGSQGSNVAFAKAFLAVLFSFEGWENATFVAGQIPERSRKTLTVGFISAVCTVGSLYLIVVAVVLHSIRYDDFPAGHNLNYPTILSGNNATARRAWPAIIAISSFGSLNAIIYTFSRVKQVIGQAEILPWSRYLKQDDCLNRTEKKKESYFQYKSPQGGLIAHWLSTVLWIAISASISSPLESVTVAGYVQTYTHCFILMVLGLGYFNLESRHKALNPTIAHTNARSGLGRFFDASVLVVIIYTLTNLALMIIVAIPPYVSTDGSDNVFPGWGFPTIIVGSLAIGAAYYLLFFAAAPRRYKSPSANANSGEESQSVGVDGILEYQSRFNLMKYADVKCTIMKDVSYRRVERVYRFGRRWEIVYDIQGVDNDAIPRGPRPENGVNLSMFLYWVFGGTRLKDERSPWSKIKRRWNGIFPW